MPKFIIERDVPGARALSRDALQDPSRKSHVVIEATGPRIQWIHRGVTADEPRCIDSAHDAAAVREHARRAGFPVNQVERICTVIDPALAV